MLMTVGAPWVPSPVAEPVGRAPAPTPGGVRGAPEAPAMTRTPPLTPAGVRTAAVTVPRAPGAATEAVMARARELETASDPERPTVASEVSPRAAVVVAGGWTPRTAVELLVQVDGRETP